MFGGIRHSTKQGYSTWLLDQFWAPGQGVFGKLDLAAGQVRLIFYNRQSNRSKVHGGRGFLRRVVRALWAIHELMMSAVEMASLAHCALAVVSALAVSPSAMAEANRDQIASPDRFVSVPDSHSGAARRRHTRDTSGHHSRNRMLCCEAVTPRGVTGTPSSNRQQYALL